MEALKQMSEVIDIILIDDHKLFREGIKKILDFEPNLRVIAEGNDGNDAIRLMEEHDPDIILMDINMPEMNGVEATSKLIEQYPDAHVIILSIHDDESYVTHALKTGARGYLLKEMDSNSLIEAIHVVHSGGSYLHPKVTHNLVQEFRRLSLEKDSYAVEQRIQYEKPLHLLTNRECQVLQLMAEGNSNRSISEKLYISEKTVKNHVSNILQKMRVRDRTQAVVKAIRNGWVEVLNI